MRYPNEDGSAPTAVGAYIFAGGFTIGVSKHFTVRAHLEASQYGVKSSQRNFPGLSAYTRPELWPLAELARSGVDFVYANPPCAMFSAAGAVMRGGRDAWRKDPRQRCWRECFVAAEAIQPKVFALESVTHALTRGRAFVDQFQNMAADMGYSVTHVLVDAKNHGVPQKRKRYFFVAHRVKLDFTLDPAHAHPPTVREVLASLGEGFDPGWVPAMQLEHELLVPYMRPLGPRLRDIWEDMNPPELQRRDAHGRVIGRPRQFVHRVDPDGLIGTIAGDYFVHPWLDRHLGTRELRVLNSFPADYWLEGEPGGHASLLARGVCPAVAEWLAKTVKAGLERGESTSGKVTEVDLREGLA